MDFFPTYSRETSSSLWMTFCGGRRFSVGGAGDEASALLGCRAGSPAARPPSMCPLLLPRGSLRLRGGMRHQICPFHCTVEHLLFSPRRPPCLSPESTTTTILPCCGGFSLSRGKEEEVHCLCCVPTRQRGAHVSQPFFSLLHLRAGQTRVVRLGGRSSALPLRRKSLPVVYSDPFPLNKTEVAKRLSLFKYY